MKNYKVQGLGRRGKDRYVQQQRGKRMGGRERENESPREGEEGKSDVRVRREGYME